MAEAVADERPGAIKAASIDALFVADLQSLRVAILTARGSAAPIDGASRAKALRHLLSVAPPPGEPSNQGLAFDDLARLCLHSMQMLLSAIKADTMVMAMVRAPQPVADRVAASQTRGARRIFDEAVDIARSRASPEDIRKARRIVLDWSAESLRRGDIVFMAPSRTSDAGGHDA